MKKYTCSICNYIYNPEEEDLFNKIMTGTPFEDLPSDWICPVCDAPKEKFKPVE